jgi:hypothetical protein
MGGIMGGIMGDKSVLERVGEKAHGSKHVLRGI